MYALQAQQIADGSWYTLGLFACRADAEFEMTVRPSYRRRTVKYRIIKQ